ncbi:MAG: hypothetical protein ABF760_04170 [Zymomonas mobilis]|uniref:Uncharacterized protein n=1 Tax=Zymomonas mobilis TaxID=542 RepID=A0A542VZ73_ZYMMB|nr:hypothetical protein [Zymomonas mobilis]TQL16632.1 hypothetical protein FBY58_0168 [Zymomonas mobilis]
MEQVSNIIAGALAIYFIIAMLMFFYWLYFRKGSLKKALMHIAISVVLLCAVVGVQMLKWSHDSKVVKTQTAEMHSPVDIAPELLEILKSNADPASVDPAKVEAVAALADQRLGAAGQEYAPALKKYFVYYNSKLAQTKLPETMAGIKFDAQRRNAER